MGVARIVAGALWILALAGLGRPAWSAPITFAFTGFVREVRGNSQPLADVGTPVSGTYTFDSEVEDPPPDRGDYGWFFFDSPSGVSVTLGELNVRSHPESPNISIRVVDGKPGADQDEYRLESLHQLPVEGLESFEFRTRIKLRDPSGTALTSVELPLAPSDVSQWTQDVHIGEFFGLDLWGCQFSFANCLFSKRVIVTLDSIELVSEPSRAELRITSLALIAALAAVRVRTKERCALAR